MYAGFLRGDALILKSALLPPDSSGKISVSISFFTSYQYFQKKFTIALFAGSVGSSESTWFFFASDDHILTVYSNPRTLQMGWSKNVTELKTQEHVDVFLTDHLKRIPTFLLFVYAPWCGHCKNSKADIEKFAIEMPEVPVIVYDGSKFRTSVVNVDGFPTIFTKKDQSAVSMYNGSRSADKLMEFFSKNTSGGGFFSFFF